MMKTKKLALGIFVVALCNTAILPAHGQEVPEAAKRIGSKTTTTHATAAAAAATTGTEIGLVAVAVSILGLIALAASSSSGDSTPAATNH